VAVDEAPTNGVPAGWVVISSSHSEGDGKPPVEPPSVSESALQLGRRSAATSGMSEKDYNAQQDPASIANWFETKLRPMLEQVASPKTISDVAALLVPDAAGVVVGARAATRAAGAGSELLGQGMEALGQSRAMRHLSGWTAAGTAAHGNLGKAAALGAAAPTLEYGGKGLQAAGQFLQRVGARPADLAAEAAAAEAAGARTAAAAAETPRELTARLTAENAARHAAPPEAPAPPAAPPTNNVQPPVVVEPPPATTPANTPSPAVRAALPVIRGMTTDQWQTISKLPVEERQLYVRLRNVGDTHAEAIRTLDYARESQQLSEQASNARAMVGKEKAASELFGTSSPEAVRKIEALAPGPSRQPLAGVNAAMDARFKQLISDPKMAWLLPLLGGGAGLGALAQREKN
jgi:hypothetical protein